MWTRPAAALAALCVILAGPLPAQAETAPTTVAGTGATGATGDGGPATQSTLNGPLGAAVGPDGTLYIADTRNHKIRAVGPDGIIRTVAGSGQAPDLAPKVAAGAKATDVALLGPSSVAVGADGTLYIADAIAVRVYAVRKDGTITILATSFKGAPTAVAAAPNGEVYVADQDGNRVLAVQTDGRVRVVAGDGNLVVSAAGGPAATIPVGAPNGLATSADGDLWISGGLLLRRLRAKQLVTVTQPAAGKWATADGAQWPPADQPLNNVEMIAAGADSVFVFDRKQSAVLRLGPDGTISTVATLNGADLGTVFLASGTTANAPLYIVDTGHNRVLSVPIGAAPQAAPPSSSKPIWPWVAGGAVVLILLVIVVVGRRRAGR